ncbi:MAG TPA: DHH family phosphoesterase, partial [bacterium]|nr:DHH family phosphoesterase [bacterium]
MEKRWLVKPVADRSIIDQFPELNNIIVQLLFNRGLTSQAAIDDFLNPSYDDHSHSPFLFSDMEQAVGRIFAAIRQKEKIMIYGDYDADGVCASAILFSTLKAFGADVDIYIPFRDTEGYGLNQKVVKRIINQGFQLLITVDCGIANKEEIEILNQGGVAVIVTDHHQEPPTLPQALA